MSTFLLLLLFAANTVNTPAADLCPEKMFHISGTLYSTSVYQGGMYRGDEDMPPQIPLANFTLLAVRWIDEKTIPEVAATFTSDANGNFKVALPAGKYGFVTQAEKEKLARGQWLPQTITTDNLAESYHCWWELSTNAPVDLTNDSVNGITLIRHESTVCGLCP
ncbi:MAG: hypothetical protein HYZ14_07800 [Bacteroidetes bacterium]|nr:hypothetical protein [Bacteroidota bacterium]